MQSSQAELRTTNPDDALSEFLCRLYLPGWRDGSLSFTEPWRLDVRSGSVAFYVVRAGCCTLERGPGIEPVALNAGDYVVLTDGSPHSLRGVSDESPQLFESLPLARRPYCREDWTCLLSTSLLYGYFETHQVEANSLEQLFPALIQLSSHSCHELARMDTLLQVISVEEESASAGSRAVVSRLVQVLLVQTLRACLATETATYPHDTAHDGNHYVAILDPVIGPVVRLIHSEPEKNWTVPTMARRSRLSKSTFSERFRRVVGRPPLDYVTEVRMRKACGLLNNTSLCVKRIATLVGYESVSAFSSAFKRRIGRAPAAFRRQG